jgi:hypothetical protein
MPRDLNPDDERRGAADFPGPGEPPLEPPEITIADVQPRSDLPGAQITLTGSRFGARVAPAGVSVGAEKAEIVTWGTATVRARVPPLTSLGAGGRTAVTIVTSTGGLGTFHEFVVLEPAPPTITGLSAAAGVPGAELRITGRGFGVSETPGSDATLADRPLTLRSWTPTEVRVRLPALATVGGPGPKPLVVRTPWGTSAAVTLTLAEPPAIAAVTPAVAPPDGPVTITGRGFDAFAAPHSAALVRSTDASGRVHEAALDVERWTPTEIVGHAPGLAALKTSGAKQLVVRTPLATSAPAALSIDAAASITSWTRLEPRCRTEETEAGLGAGLQAALADGLWMLGRQWMLGELHGEDAGSPVRVEVEAESARLWRWRAAGAAAVELAPGVPLETVVECERVTPHRDAGDTPFADRRLAVEAGQQFLRQLAARVGDPARAAAYRRGFITDYALLPSGDDDATLDPDSRRFLELVADRVPDGARLHDALRDALPPPQGSDRLPARPLVAEPDRAAVRAAVADWFAWCETFAAQPAERASAWDPERLEYRFSVAANSSSGELVLAAPEYAGGRLDWPDFVATGDALAAGAGAPPPPVPIRRSAIPAPVTYPGMPAPRWWEIEDARVDFGAVETGPTDVLTMLFVEFATVCGNDWFMLPLDGIPTGSVVQMGSMRVTDSFGEQTRVEPFRTPGTSGWRMFELSATDGRERPDVLLIPLTILGGAESAPLEDVRLLRDELANLGWAIEHTVAGAAGRPVRRAEPAARRPRPWRAGPGWSTG